MQTTKKIERILLIDDDEAIRELMALLLELEGYDTVGASNGSEGIALLQEQEVDLIIVDLMMPVMDGLRFLRWLRREAQLDLPVLVLTGRERADTEQEVLEAGATALMYKPVSDVQIREQLQSLQGL